jgi:hypothetical protein
MIQSELEGIGQHRLTAILETNGSKFIAGTGATQLEIASASVGLIKDMNSDSPNSLVADLKGRAREGEILHFCFYTITLPALPLQSVLGIQGITTEQLYKLSRKRVYRSKEIGVFGDSVDLPLKGPEEITLDDFETIPRKYPSADVPVNDTNLWATYRILREYDSPKAFLAEMDGKVRISDDELKLSIIQLLSTEGIERLLPAHGAGVVTPEELPAVFAKATEWLALIALSKSRHRKNSVSYITPFPTIYDLNRGKEKVFHPHSLALHHILDSFSLYAAGLSLMAGKANKAHLYDIKGTLGAVKEQNQKYRKEYGILKTKDINSLFGQNYIAFYRYQNWIAYQMDSESRPQPEADYVPSGLPQELEDLRLLGIQTDLKAFHEKIKKVIKKGDK